MAEITKQQLFYIASAVVALMFINNWGIPLWNDDEAAYAGISMHMLESGDFLNPNFHYSDIHRKTPLHFWFISLFYKLFGYNEWAVRFSSSLATLGTAALIFQWIKKEVGLKVATFAAFIFCTNFLVSGLAKIAFVDATLVFFSTLSAISLYKIINKEGSAKWLVFFWMGMAFGLLTKGPVILIFLGLLGLSWMIVNKDWTVLKRIQLYWLPIALLPLLTWGWMSWQQDNGVFIKWLLDWYIFKRATGSVLGQTGPPGYHLLIIIVSFIPYLVGLIFAGTLLFKKELWQNKFLNFVMLWVFSGWIFYEIMPSKLPNYGAAAYPALSILVAIALFKIDQRVWSKGWFKLTVFVQLILAICITVFTIIFIRNDFGMAGVMFSILFGLSMIISCIFFILFLESNKPSSAIISLGVGAFFSLFILWSPLGSTITPLLSGPQQIGRLIQFELDKKDEVLLAVREHHLISLPFYIEKNSKIQLSDNIEYYLEDIKKFRFKAVVCTKEQEAILDSKTYQKKEFDVLDMNSGKIKHLLVLIFD